MNFKSGACLLLLALPASPARGEEVAAVLPALSGAYREAFASFQAAYGAEVPFYDLSRGDPVLPARVSIVVAFGGRAASLRYPETVAIVYPMAPGLLLKPGAAARNVKISLIPGPAKVLGRIKQLQPGIRRLAVFWSAPRYDELAGEAAEAGAALGLEVYPVRVPAAENLPAALRKELGNMQAFWLPPDPLLVTPGNLRILREFSWGNRIPFYGSTKGMTREGAAASIGVSFRDIGTAAAAAVRELQAGRAVPRVIYPADEELTLNASAARRCGLDLPGRLVQEAEHLFP